MKNAAGWIGRIALVGVGLALLGVAYVWAQLPKRGEERIDAGEGIVGVWAGGSYAWIVRTPKGAVLVDAGIDPDGGAILAELQRQGLTPDQIHGVLITHAHADHWAAARLFPNAKIVIGEADLPLLRGEVEPKSPMTKLFSKLVDRPTPPTAEPVKDGQGVELDGEAFKVYAVPGHTAGSTMYLHRDVLFTGDSLLGKKDALAVHSSLLSEDREQNLESLKKLQGEPFNRIADGHTGLHEDAQAKLARLLP